MLLNVIHPHMYKVSNNRLMMGPIPYFSERDTKVSEFISKGLDARVDVLVQKNYPGSKIRSKLEDEALFMDSLYQILGDSRIKTCITTQWGVPLPDTQPDCFNDEIWNEAIKIYDQHSGLKTKVGDNTKAIFIGGALENCVANAMGYFQDEFSSAGKDIFYVPELCVSVNPEQLAVVETKFRERGFSELTTEQALNLMKRK